MLKRNCIFTLATLSVVRFACAQATDTPTDQVQVPQASTTQASTLQGSADQIQEVVVTAERVAQPELKVPESMSVFSSSSLQTLNIHSFEDIATKVPNLSIAWGASGGGNGAALGFGGGRSIAIRGISGGDTVGFYIDDTPVPDTIDPEVVDLARIEVLKGPQGTLYGEGSMGGNIRYITNQPSFTPELTVTTDVGYTDHAATPDAREEIIGNMPLVADVAAVRAVAFADHDGGFITRAFPAGATGQLQEENNQGAVFNYGGSLSLLIKPTEHLQILPRIMGQSTHSHGLADAFAPLPSMDVQSYTLVQPANVQEGYTDKWYLPSLEIKDKLGSWDLVSSTSYFNRYLYQIEDGTQGNIEELSAPPFNVPPSVWAGGVAWPQFQSNSNAYEEVRAAWAGNAHARAIVGGFYSNEAQQWRNGSPTFDFPGLVTSGAFFEPLLWDQPIDSRLLDRSLYGEVYFMASGWQLTLGGRKFWLNETFQSYNNGLLAGGLVTGPPLKSSQSGFSPKASLSYTVSDNTMVYATAAKGFRAGGPNTPLEAACDAGLTQLGLSAGEFAQYQSDNLWDYEVGAKSRAGRFLVTGALFEMRWNNIQQNIAIPVCDLPVTTNAGAAEIPGAELSVDGKPLADLEFRLSVGYEHPRITEQGLSPYLTIGSRIQDIPYITASSALTYTHRLTESVSGFVSTDYSYVGNSTSDVTTSTLGLPGAMRPGYGLWNARMGANWENKRLFLYVKNITNKMANLGDINPIAFPYISAQTGLPVPRVAVTRPLQIGVEFSWEK